MYAMAVLGDERKLMLIKLVPWIKNAKGMKV
jgi:hypothetical protein